MHLRMSNWRDQRKHWTFSKCISHLVDAAISVLDVGHSIANEAANHILSRGAFVIFQAFLLIEQIGLVRHYVKAMLL